ncbi:MAG: ECF transporter S component, partial [Actinomycetota bacterium]
MSTSTRTPNATSTGTGANPRRWRVVDIDVAAVLGVAVGLIFWGWNVVGGAWFGAADAVTPGLGGVAVGIWLIGGVIGGLVIRKPGAALVVEVVAAIVSMLIGNVWGVSTVLSGLVQGLGAELIFALFLYRRFGLG